MKKDCIRDSVHSSRLSMKMEAMTITFFKYKTNEKQQSEFREVQTMLGLKMAFKYITALFLKRNGVEKEEVEVYLNTCKLYCV